MLQNILFTGTNMLQNIIFTALICCKTSSLRHKYFANIPYRYMWRGYMASQLSSLQLILFAFLTFVIAQPRIKVLLVASLLTGENVF